MGFKISPQKHEYEKIKRSQKKIQNHFEAIRGRGNKKKDNEDAKKKPKRAPESL